ncbi:GrpB family protein [Plantibacter sp. CFBP 8798]|uniref:GrpB family protein n=1 Tax=Plantibacter sp. CFBP 8798 TaxID=2775268 RepID=UPI003158254C
MLSPQSLSEADRRLVASWAADCAERVLPLFEAEAPDDDRPRDAIARARAYASGELDTAGEIRRRFVANRASQVVSSPAAKAAAWSAGQAAGVAHMGAHALGAAAYAAKAAELHQAGAGTAEIAWQLEHLSEPARTALRLLPALGTDPSGPLGSGLLASGVLGDNIRAIQNGLLRRPCRPDVTTLELVGGPEPVRVELHDADPEWPERYREHRQRILDALETSTVAIEHIGSTSVPGLAAKPIVDIVVAVEDITAEEDYLDPLLTAGYVLRVREPRHRMVRTPERDVHVHLYEQGAPEIDEYLLLRDHLRSDADDRALYERTKRELLGRSWDDMNDYADAKTEVILAIKARARAALSR